MTIFESIRDHDILYSTNRHSETISSIGHKERLNHFKFMSDETRVAKCCKRAQVKLFTFKIKLRVTNHPHREAYVTLTIYTANPPNQGSYNQ